ncbi:MAG TPA: hypothetical protein VF691_19015, partial [Cytophagaceae bacterium]
MSSVRDSSVYPTVLLFARRGVEAYSSVSLFARYALIILTSFFTLNSTCFPANFLTYDLISNKVTKVKYNEQFFHRYSYDEDNRL